MSVSYEQGIQWRNRCGYYISVIIGLVNLWLRNKYEVINNMNTVFYIRTNLQNTTHMIYSMCCLSPLNTTVSYTFTCPISKKCKIIIAEWVVIMAMQNNCFFCTSQKTYVRFKMFHKYTRPFVKGQNVWTLEVIWNYTV